jgi:glycerophosphoryl diester phosphodiesterase
MHSATHGASKTKKSTIAATAMQILSHRGCYRGSTTHENSPAAFERAIALGVDGIETDIRLSADGEPILFHDRIAPGDRPVESLTRRELQDVMGHEIPALGEILCRWPEVFWNLEVKCVAAVPATIDLLKRHSRPEEILVTSFRHDIVARCAQELDVACGLIVAHAPVDVSLMLGAWQAVPRVRTVVWDFNVLDSVMVERAKQCGFKVYVYGMATVPEHQSCRAWGMAGMITDFPDRARDGS